MGNVLGPADPLEEVADFQRDPPTMQTLAEAAEGTVLASQRPAASPALQHTASKLQTDFSGDFGLTAPGAPRPAATAAVYLPRADSAARGLVEEGTDGKGYVAVQVRGAAALRRPARAVFVSRSVR